MCAPVTCLMASRVTYLSQLDVTIDYDSSLYGSVLTESQESSS